MRGQSLLITWKGGRGRGEGKEDSGGGGGHMREWRGISHHQQSLKGET